MDSARVGVVFHVVFEFMVMPSKDRRDVMRAEQRHIPYSNSHSRKFCNAVSPRCEWGVMQENDHIHKAISVQTLQLTLHPVELCFIGRNVGIQSDHKRVSVSERIGWITRKSSSRTIRRNDLRHHGEI